jgi:hypothetical protein
MTRLMRDSTNLKDIPIPGTDLVTGYVNGNGIATKEDFARFPGIPHVHIDALGTDPESAGVLDFEKGNPSTPESCANWAKRRKAAHPHVYPAVIYCDRSHLTPLFNAMNAAGLHIVRDFRLWIATLDGTKMVADMTGVTAVQFAGEKMTGGHFDESIVYDDDWKRVTHG